MSGMSGHVRSCPVDVRYVSGSVSGSMSDHVRKHVRKGVRKCPMLSDDVRPILDSTMCVTVRSCPVVSGRVRSCPIMSECPGCPPGDWGLSPQPEAGTGLGLGTQAQAGGSHLGARPSTPRRPRCHPRLTLDALDVPTTGTVFEGTQLYPR